MRHLLFTSALIYVCASGNLLSQSAYSDTLEICVSGIRNPQGNICIGVSNTADGWPRESFLELRMEKKDMKDGVLVYEVTDLPYGTYAICALDDENQNTKLDMFLGIPKEKFGFSKNPKVRLSAPKFEQCSFVVDSVMTSITIQLR